MESTENIALSLVIPCYNEGEVLAMLQARLRKALNELAVPWEVIFVDDGSRDGTFGQLAAMHAAEPRFKVISFSRNFGHQAAISAGLAHASGNAVGIMDADLQDPPELLGACLEKLRQGFDVVYAVRKKRKENLAKRLAYALFYRLLRGVAEADIPLDSGDFCVMSRRVADVLRGMPERNIFLRGMRAWTGFRQTGLRLRARRPGGGPNQVSFSQTPPTGDGWGFLLLELPSATRNLPRFLRRWVFHDYWTISADLADLRFFFHGTSRS